MFVTPMGAQSWYTGQGVGTGVGVGPGVAVIVTAAGVGLADRVTAGSVKDVGAATRVTACAVEGVGVAAGAGDVQPAAATAASRHSAAMAYLTSIKIHPLVNVNRF